jgi:hypothetical protein
MIRIFLKLLNRKFEKGILVYNPDNSAGLFAGQKVIIS